MDSGQDQAMSPVDASGLHYHTAAEDRVPLGRKIFYALGTAPDPLIIGQIGNFTMTFYSVTLGLSASAVGWILFIPRMWDAINDPIMGRWSDNCRSRYGRRRPFILVGGVLMVVCYVLLWSPPTSISSDGGLLTYLLIVSMLFFTFQTVFKIPYDALAYEISPDYQERTGIQTYRKMAHGLGEMTIGVLPLFAGWWAVRLGHAAEDDRVGYFPAALCFGAFCLVMIVLSATGSRERPAALVAAELPFFKAFTTTVSNLVFLRLALSWFLVVLAIYVLAMSSSYLFQYYLVSKELLLAHWVVSGFLGLVASPLWWWITNRLGKPRAFSLAVGMLAVTSIGAFFFFDHTHPNLVIWTYTPLYGISWAGAIILINSLMAEITDLDELNTGQRREGSYTGVFGFINKFGVAFAFPVIGTGIELTGFDAALKADQPDDVFVKMKLLMAGVGAALMLLGMLCNWNFPITPARALEIRAQLEERRGRRGAVK